MTPKKRRRLAFALALVVAGFGRAFQGQPTRWTRLAGISWAVLVAALVALLSLTAAPSPPWPQLADSDALMKFTVHTASAIAAIPTGVVGDGDWIGRRLFES